MRKMIRKILENVREARDGGWAQGVPDDMKLARPRHNPKAYGGQYTINIYGNDSLAGDIPWSAYDKDTEIGKGNGYDTLLDFLRDLEGGTVTDQGPSDEEGEPNRPGYMAGGFHRAARKDPSQSYTRCPNCKGSKCRRSCPNYRSGKETGDYYRHKGKGGTAGSKW